MLEHVGGLCPINNLTKFSIEKYIDYMSCHMSQM